MLTAGAISGQMFRSSQYEKIKAMRVNITAMVDTHGCDKLWAAGDRNYQILIALLLSSQTKDEQTSIAVRNLQRCGINSANTALKFNTDEINDCIKNVGFHNKKSQYLLKLSKILVNDFGGKVPNNYIDLISLPGIGPKMALLTLECAFNKIEGIAVDLHVHRIANRLEWCKTKTAEATRSSLERAVDKRIWGGFNACLVGFGQVVCTAKRPNCQNCTLKDECSFNRIKL